MLESSKIQWKTKLCGHDMFIRTSYQAGSCIGLIDILNVMDVYYLLKSCQFVFPKNRIVSEECVVTVMNTGQQNISLRGYYPDLIVFSNLASLFRQYSGLSKSTFSSEILSYVINIMVLVSSTCWTHRVYFQFQTSVLYY